MKRIYTYILLIFCMTLIGCTENYDEGLELYPTLVPRYISVSLNYFTFEAKTSETKHISISSTETPWKIDNSVDWINLSANSGNSTSSIQIGVKENTSGDDARLGIFYVKSNVDDWKYESPITVRQAGAVPYITPDYNEFDLPGSINEKSFSVASNCSWEVTSNSSWLTCSKNGDKVSFSTTTNETTTYRNGVITLSHTGIRNASSNIIVRQAPASITASTETLTFNNNAGMVELTVNAEASWTASSSASWIEVSPTSGNSGSSTMKVSVSPNTSTSERTGYVNLSIGGSQRIQIPVRQRGIYVETEQSELSFAAAGGSLNLSVLSNTNWTVSSVPSWITVSPNQGEGDGTVKVTASDNPNTANRSGVIHLTQTGLSIDVAVTVSQAGKTFDVNTTVLNFEDKSSTQTINIQTDGTWTASASDSWITISPTTASGNSTLSVSVSENTSDDERSGQVVVVMADKSATINVVQKGKYFTVSNNLLTYTSKGGAIDISITTNDSWSAKVEDGSTWLTLSKTSGTGNVDVKVTASDNASVNSRTATLLFETTHNQKIRVVVNQDARYLRVDTREILFYSKGGTSESITVSTDGTYKITCSDSWFSVSQSSNTFTVTATENSDKDPRIGSVTIALTDLKEGTYSLALTVTQLNYGGSFLRKDYDDDHNWDDMGNSTGSLTITGFGSDKNYDTNTTSGTTLSVSGYQSDKNWDESSSSGVTVSVTGYNSDKNFDSQTNSSGAVSKQEFDPDHNWQ